MVILVNIDNTYRQKFFAQVGSVDLPYLDKELHRSQMCLQTQFTGA